ncbi:MAG TPA: tetratricopeptide repeat protein [Planctomycetota bacterium]|nr:tetratricopeptide repeat protein [Planctomycetota bacterium]
MQSRSAAAPSRPAIATRAPIAGHPRWLSWLPLLLTVSLFGFLLLPRVHGNAHMLLAFAGVPGAMLVWQVLLRWRAHRTGRPLQVEFAPPVRQHYIQACVQFSLYLYWGWYWQQDGVRPIYAQAPLIVAQAIFIYAFDGLLAWSRGRTWRLSSGPMPIVMSTNLFIWFRDDWFVFQFAMVAAGLLGKEFVKWQREGRRTHIFNPSGFGLAVTATVLIATGTVDLTWAKPLATTIEVPGVFVFIFLIGLVVQYFFAVTLMTFTAAMVFVLFDLAYTQITGVYLFASTNLPAAAFLGLHLLMTDPSTSPRTNVGRTLFGLGYGIGYIVLFEVLGWIGAPELFAKLYPVPILNCTVQWLDRRARSGRLGRLNQRWETAGSPRVVNLAHMGVWAAVFLVLLGTGFVQGPHPGNSILFWKQAVKDGKADAARKLVMVAGSQAIGTNSPDAYNELGLLSLQGTADQAAEATVLKSAAHWFGLAAQGGSPHAAENIVQMFLFLGVHRSDAELAAVLQRLEHEAGKPTGKRACYLLALAYETEGARPLDHRRALELYRRCGPGDLFAQKGIARIGLAAGSLVDLTGTAPVLAATATGDGESCFYLAYMHDLGRGVLRDAEKARTLFRRAFELGFEPAKAWKVDAVIPAFAPPRRKFMVRPAWSTAFPL